MIKIEKYDGTKTYMFPNGRVATPDIVKEKYPAITQFTHVVEVSGNVLQAIMELASLRQVHNIDEKWSDDAAIEAIQEKLNIVPETIPSAEERIAAALEFQNLMAL